MTRRHDLEEIAKQFGFNFATENGQIYWDETSAYRFTLQQVEDDIEAPSTELHGMCREAVDKIIHSEQLMDRLCIPEEHRDYISESWRANDKELYGRFDLAYNGRSPAKLLEYNADTPTTLYEASAFQWKWLEDMISNGELPSDADQYNRTYEAISERFAEIFEHGSCLHFSSVGGEMHAEDFATVETLAWAAKDAGLTSHYVAIENIGLSEDNHFLDEEGRVMTHLFKLYPWEDMLREDFGQHLVASGCQMIEPAWKAILSNKGVLPVLWEMFEGHPNLLPAFFAEDVARKSDLLTRSQDILAEGYVKKPLFSREGASVSIFEKNKLTEAAEDRSYDEFPMIVQAYQPLPVLGGHRPVIGSWVAGETACGLGIREDQSRITKNMSCFKPHFILD